MIPSSLLSKSAGRSLLFQILGPEVSKSAPKQYILPLSLHVCVWAEDYQPIHVLQQCRRVFSTLQKSGSMCYLLQRERVETGTGIQRLNREEQYHLRRYIRIAQTQIIQKNCEATEVSNTERLYPHDWKNAPDCIALKIVSKNFIDNGDIAILMSK